MHFNTITAPDTGEFGLKRESLLLPEPIVVEFAGPPGAGKSTSAGVFKSFLENKDIRVAEFSDVKKHLKSQSKFAIAQLAIKALAKKTGAIGKFLVLLIRNRAFSISSFYRFLKLCVFHEALQRYRKVAHTDIIILDQWIVQGLWSAILFRDRPFDLSAFLFGFHSNVDWLVYFETDAETAAQRIAGRTTATSRFDQFGETQNMRELKRSGNSLYRLFTASPCRRKTIFNTDVPPQNNAKKFFALMIEGSSKTRRP